MIQLSIVRQHHNFSRKVIRKKSIIQIDVVQNSSQLSSIRRHFRVNIVVTNNMSTYESNLDTINSISENCFAKNNFDRQFIEISKVQQLCNGTSLEEF